MRSKQTHRNERCCPPRQKGDSAWSCSLFVWVCLCGRHLIFIYFYFIQGQLKIFDLETHTGRVERFHTHLKKGTESSSADFCSWLIGQRASLWRCLKEREREKKKKRGKRERRGESEGTAEKMELDKRWDIEKGDVMLKGSKPPQRMTKKSIFLFFLHLSFAIISFFPFSSPSPYPAAFKHLWFLWISQLI